MPSDPSKAQSPLRSTLAGDPDMAELVGLFVADLPQRIASIEAAWSARRTTDVQRLAHQLRGSSASYGFAPIGESAGRLEDALRSLGASPEASLDELNQSVRELLALCARASNRAND